MSSRKIIKSLFLLLPIAIAIFWSVAIADAQSLDIGCPGESSSSSMENQK